MKTNDAFKQGFGTPPTMAKKQGKTNDNGYKTKPTITKEENPKLKMTAVQNKIGTPTVKPQWLETQEASAILPDKNKVAEMYQPLPNVPKKPLKRQSQPLPTQGVGKGKDRGAKLKKVGK